MASRLDNCCGTTTFARGERTLAGCPGAFGLLTQQRDPLAEQGRCLSATSDVGRSGAAHDGNSAGPAPFDEEVYPVIYNELFEDPDVHDRRDDRSDDVENGFRVLDRCLLESQGSSGNRTSRSTSVRCFTSTGRASTIVVYQLNSSVRSLTVTS